MKGAELSKSDTWQPLQVPVQLHISSSREGVTVTFGSSAAEAKPQPQRLQQKGAFFWRPRRRRPSGRPGQTENGLSKVDLSLAAARALRRPRPPPPRCKFISQVTVLLPCARYRVVRPRAGTFKICTEFGIRSVPRFCQRFSWQCWADCIATLLLGKTKIAGRNPYGYCVLT